MANINDSSYDLTQASGNFGAADPLSRALTSAENKLNPPGGPNTRMTSGDLLDLQRKSNQFGLYVSLVSNVMKVKFDALKSVVRNFGS